MSTMNQNSLNGSVIIAEDGSPEFEEETDKKPMIQSFIDMDILKELQRELHLLDVENEFDVKVMCNKFIKLYRDKKME